MVNSEDAVRSEVEQLARRLAAHEGRVNAYWEHQHQLNNHIGERLSALEKRVVWLTAAAAAGGSMAPHLLKLLGVMG